MLACAVALDEAAEEVEAAGGVAAMCRVGHSFVKAQMRELRVARNAAIEAHDHKELRVVRRKIYSLNRKIRRVVA